MWCFLSFWGVSYGGGGRRLLLVSFLFFIFICVDFITWGVKEDDYVLVVEFEFGLNINVFVVFMGL